MSATALHHLVEIPGANIILRELTVGDVTQKYCDWMNDFEVVRYTESRFSSHSIESLKRYVREIQASQDTRFMGIYSKETQEHVGNIKLGPISSAHSFAEVGIIIGNKSFWGKGIASEAIALLCDHSFRELKLNKVFAGCYGSNLGAIRAFKNAGFEEVARHPRHMMGAEGWEDMVDLELLNPDRHLSNNVSEIPDFGTLREIFDREELGDAFRCLDANSWKIASGKLEYLPVDYSEAMIDYQLSYYAGCSAGLTDLSVTILHDNQPVGLWPLAVIVGKRGERSLGSNGGMMLPPLFIRELPSKIKKNKTANCIRVARALAQSQEIKEWTSRIGVVPDGSRSLHDWHHLAMREGGTVSVRHEMFLDLKAEIAQIRGGFRKSYKSLINSGSKIWKVEMMREENPSVWKEFKELHRLVSGRTTRTDESWEFQLRAIKDGAAFFIGLREQSNRMVGGGLFHVTPHEGYYAVGAYDRSLFDKPLGHVVQSYAIEEMRRRGVQWYKLGDMFYPSDFPTPSRKEISISEFKQGFSSHLMPKYIIKHECK